MDEVSVVVMGLRTQEEDPLPMPMPPPLPLPPTGASIVSQYEASAEGRSMLS